MRDNRHLCLHPDGLSASHICICPRVKDHPFSDPEKPVTEPEHPTLFDMEFV